MTSLTQALSLSQEEREAMREDILFLRQRAKDLDDAASRTSVMTLDDAQRAVDIAFEAAGLRATANRHQARLDAAGEK